MCELFFRKLRYLTVNGIKRLLCLQSAATANPERPEDSEMMEVTEVCLERLESVFSSFALHNEK